MTASYRVTDRRRDHSGQGVGVATAQVGDRVRVAFEAVVAGRPAGGVPDCVVIDVDEHGRRYVVHESAIAEVVNPAAVGDAVGDRAGLDRLPVGVVTRHEHGEVATKLAPNEWHVAGDEDRLGSDYLDLPVLVLWLPGNTEVVDDAADLTF